MATETTKILLTVTWETGTAYDWGQDDVDVQASVHHALHGYFLMEEREHMKVTGIDTKLVTEEDP